MTKEMSHYPSGFNPELYTQQLVNKQVQIATGKLAAGTNPAIALPVDHQPEFTAPELELPSQNLEPTIQIADIDLEPAESIAPPKIKRNTIKTNDVFVEPEQIQSQASNEEVTHAWEDAVHHSAANFTDSKVEAKIPYYLLSDQAKAEHKQEMFSHFDSWFGYGLYTNLFDHESMSTNVIARTDQIIENQLDNFFAELDEATLADDNKVTELLTARMISEEHKQKQLIIEEEFKSFYSANNILNDHEHEEHHAEHHPEGKDYVKDMSAADKQKVHNLLSEIEQKHTIATLKDIYQNHPNPEVKALIQKSGVLEEDLNTEKLQDLISQIQALDSVDKGRIKEVFHTVLDGMSKDILQSTEQLESQGQVELAEQLYHLAESKWGQVSKEVSNSQVAKIKGRSEEEIRAKAQKIATDMLKRNRQIAAEANGGPPAPQPSEAEIVQMQQEAQEIQNSEHADEIEHLAEQIYRQGLEKDEEARQGHEILAEQDQKITGSSTKEADQNAYKLAREAQKGNKDAINMARVIRDAEIKAYKDLYIKKLSKITNSYASTSSASPKQDGHDTQINSSNSSTNLNSTTESSHSERTKAIASRFNISPEDAASLIRALEAINESESTIYAMTGFDPNYLLDKLSAKGLSAAVETIYSNGLTPNLREIYEISKSGLGLNYAAIHSIKNQRNHAGAQRIPNKNLSNLA